MAKILLVDDDDRILESFGRLLRRKGFEVKVVDGAHKALEEITEYKPDLIISDMRMQPMDGVELMKSVPEKDGYYPGKLIFTAFDDGDALKLAEMGRGGVFRVEKDRWETDLMPAIMRSLEIRETRMAAWEQGLKNTMQREEIIKLNVIRTMAATLGHEINNPLQTIASANELMIKKTGSDASNMAIRESIGRIKNVIFKLTNMLKIKEKAYAAGNSTVEL